mmetsp:Transcript_4289/g.10185  ORF Transcript_4289/g.10185 Transcript_4289/m.10185 type:complete len:274 (-) Transcript_4289:1788-2609(-)
MDFKVESISATRRNPSRIPGGPLRHGVKAASLPQSRRRHCRHRRHRRRPSPRRGPQTAQLTTQRWRSARRRRRVLWLTACCRTAQRPEEGWRGWRQAGPRTHLQQRRRGLRTPPRPDLGRRASGVAASCLRPRARCDCGPPHSPRCLPCARRPAWPRGPAPELPKPRTHPGPALPQFARTRCHSKAPAPPTLLHSPSKPSSSGATQWAPQLSALPPRQTVVAPKSRLFPSRPHSAATAWRPPASARPAALRQATATARPCVRPWRCPSRQSRP